MRSAHSAQQEIAHIALASMPKAASVLLMATVSSAAAMESVHSVHVSSREKSVRAVRVEIVNSSRIIAQAIIQMQSIAVRSK